MVSSRYLRITNNGVCDPRVFTMLGVSSAREDTSKIGQFGSGSKHGVLIALRSDTEVIITSGDTVIRPKTEETVIHNKLYRRVSFQISSFDPTTKIRKHCEEPSSMTLDFGSLDWNGAYMMIREFVSNALDASEGDFNRISISIVNCNADSIRGEEDKTSVYVQLTNEVAQVFSKIDEYFLHATNRHEIPVLVKVDGKVSYLRFYRMGVFVSETPRISIYDYNGDSSTKIDESRNMDSFDLATLASKIFATIPIREQVAAIKNIFDTPVDCLEHHFSSYRIPYEPLRIALEEKYGKDTVFTDLPLLYQKVTQTGRRCILLPSHMHNWYSAICEAGILTADKVINESIAKMEGIAKTPIKGNTVRRVINALHRMGFINKSTHNPTVYVYQRLEVDGACMFGYTDGKDIYLNHEHRNNIVTILEEVLHLYTGYKDETRSFQDIVMKVAANLLDKKIQRTRKEEKKNSIVAEV